MLQILWERKWIDVNKMNEYKMMVQDDDGFVILEYSLLVLIGRCTDFANEKSQLEFVFKSLGVEALINLKYHPEFAGEVIEYSFEHQKQCIRGILLRQKRGKITLTSLSLSASCVSC